MRFKVFLTICAVLTHSLPLAAETVLRFQTGMTRFDAPSSDRIFDSFFRGFPDIIDRADRDSVQFRTDLGGAGVALGFRFDDLPVHGLRTEITVLHARSTLSFPEGVSIFVDPARATIHTTGLDFGVSKEMARFDLFSRETTIDLNGGAVIAHVRATYNSALLDIETRNFEKTAYLRAGATHALGPSLGGANLLAEMGLYGTRTFEVRFGVEVPLGQ